MDHYPKMPYLAYAFFLQKSFDKPMNTVNICKKKHNLCMKGFKTISFYFSISENLQF